MPTIRHKVVRQALAVVVLACGMLLPSGELSAAGFSQLVVFGDSLSDTGNVSNRTFGITPGGDYFDGRFSNGPLWVEHLADQLQLNPPIPSSDDGLNYASGGAETGSGWAFFLVSPNIGRQVDDYLDDFSPAGDELFLIWGGANNYLDGEDDPADPVADLIDDIETLADAGAASFLVPNLPSLGSVPRFLNTGQQAVMRDRSIAFNDLLVDELDVLSDQREIDIFQLDIFGMFEEMLLDPAIFGFTNVTNPALDDEPANPDEYLFWDDVHPTRVAHQLIGLEAADLITSLIPGDLNGDDVVDRSDTALLIQHWGAIDAESLPADFDGNGAVDLGDLATLQQKLDPIVSSGAAVPEPASVMILLFAAIGLLFRTRRHMS